MSKHSPKPVAASEVISRFVFSPMHLTKKGELNPSFFSHAMSKGCSVQRDSLATDDELVSFTREFLSRKDEYAWVAVAATTSDALRRLENTETGKRTVCVYDTAEPNNPAHAEICRTQHIQEADAAELRRSLMRAFNDGVPIDRQVYRNGRVWHALPAELQARPIKRPRK